MHLFVDELSSEQDKECKMALYDVLQEATLNYMNERIYFHNHGLLLPK